MIDYIVDLRMVRPEVNEYVRSACMLEGWHETDVTDVFTCGFPNDMRAVEWDASFQSAIADKFGDRPFYLFYTLHL